MSKDSLLTTQIVNGNELVLQNLENKIKTGKELSNIESSMGIISAQIMQKNKFGPDITDVEINKFVLPEQVKSIIIDAIG